VNRVQRGSQQLEYRRRRSIREAKRALLEKWDRRLGNARLAVFALALAAVWPTLVSRTWRLPWLIAPLVVFVGLIVVHGPVVTALGRLRLGVSFYRRGLARMDGDWSDPLDDGSRFGDDEHPYAADLDLFGPGSLFALLCTARSLPGRETLAAWLLSPAEPKEVARRQEAAAELRGRLDLQEEIAVLAADLSPEIRAADLDAWGTAPLRLVGLTVPLVAAVLGAINLALAVGWLVGQVGGPALLPVFAVSGVLALALRARVGETLDGLAVPPVELRFFASVLRRFEAESFEGSRLRDLQSRTGDAGERPSERLLELARIIEWNDSRANVLFRPFAMLLFVGTQLAFAAERWRARHGGAIGDWLRAIGEIEALSALATFSYENGDYVVPEITPGPARFDGDALAHPLLPRATRVANDVRLGGDEPAAPLRLLLVSGSNMSGKSTLLRTVGVAAVLAFAGAPVPAERLRLSPLAVGASLQLHDSLLAGISRFYAELQRLRRIRELAQGGPALVLLDEILHGTNSHDRRLGAAGVICDLLELGAIGLVTTHDLALAEIADELAPAAANVHFEDHLEESRMAFDYRLRPGVVEHGNALALMRSLGLPVEEE
jgi:hypothetical protein